MEQPADTSSHRHKEALAAMHSTAISQPHWLEPDATPPYALLVLVKNGHVGSSWFASLVEKQPLAAFKHEANSCVRTADLILDLVTGGGCDRVSQKRLGPSDADRPTPLLGLSFNMGAFSAPALAEWRVALNSTPATVPIVVASLTRTNAVKWAWSVYRTQLANQTNHPHDEMSWSRVSVEPAKFALYARGTAKNILEVRERAETFAALLNRSVLHVTYEQLQRDAAGVLRRVFSAAGVPFNETAHGRQEPGAVSKGAPEQLSQAISNLPEVMAQPALQAPCFQQMFSTMSGEEAPVPCPSDFVLKAHVGAASSR